MVPQFHLSMMSRRLGLANVHDRVHRRRPTRMFLQSLESLEDRTLLSLLNPTWVPEGPAPRINATASVPAQQNSAVGAVNAVAFLNANTALAATVNGGIWRTSNFTAATPAWTPVSDNLSSLSITAIAVSPLTKSQPVNQQVVFAGTGASSSFGSYYGKAVGLFKSLDGGQTWQPTGTLAGSNGTINPFAGQTISSIVAGVRDPVTNQQFMLVGADNGLWRRHNSGATFSQILSAKVTNIVADPSDPSGMTYFAVSVQSGQDSVGKSTDGGNTWLNVTPSFPAVNGQQLTQQANLELAVSPNTSGSTRALYAGLVTTSLSSSSFGQPVNASIVNSFNAYSIYAPNHGLTTGDYVQVKYTYNNVDTWWFYQVTVQDANNFTIADRNGPPLATTGATLTFYKYANVNIAGPSNGTYTVTAWNHGLSNGALIQVSANNNTGYYLFLVTVQNGNAFTFQNGNSPAPQTGQVSDSQALHRHGGKHVYCVHRQCARPWVANRKCHSTTIEFELVELSDHCPGRQYVHHRRPARADPGPGIGELSGGPVRRPCPRLPIHQPGIDVAAGERRPNVAGEHGDSAALCRDSEPQHDPGEQLRARG